MAGHDGWKTQPRVPSGNTEGGQWTRETIDYDEYYNKWKVRRWKPFGSDKPIYRTEWVETEQEAKDLVEKYKSMRETPFDEDAVIEAARNTALPEDFDYPTRMAISEASKLGQLKVERLISVDGQTGEVLFKKTGGKMSVNINESDYHVFENNIMIHNHPNEMGIKRFSSYGFSDSDLDVALYLRVKTMVLTIGDYVMITSVPDVFPANRSENIKQLQNAATMSVAKYKDKFEYYSSFTIEGLLNAIKEGYNEGGWTTKWVKKE